MKIVEIPISELHPYENNPRRNESAVDAVAASIREFGFKVPIVVDAENVIVAGHTRVLAAQQIGMKSVPCIVADDLTDEQIKAFRLADNKTGELASWDFDKLEQELAKIDMPMERFGFEDDDFFKRENRNDTSREEGNDEYNEFLDKFEQKKTTDDCYTPEPVYEAVARWVEKQYGLKRENFVRPFYPGGDYQAYKYGKDAVVVDNPPFSIFSEIVRFYIDKGIKFYLFAPALTLFSTERGNVCYIPLNAAVIYENGANVATSFVTNLESGLRIKTEPELYQDIKKAVDEYRSELHAELPKYSFPVEVATSSGIAQLSKYGIKFSIDASECVRITSIDAMKKDGKGIFGNGYLISEKAAAEKAAAEKAAAEKAAATRYELSDREKQIVKSLGK